MVKLSLSLSFIRVKNKRGKLLNFIETDEWERRCGDNLSFLKLVY